MASRQILGALAKRTRVSGMQRGGGGGPVKLAPAMTQKLAEEDELMWQDGTAYPEPCLDKFEMVSTGAATAMLGAALLGFAAVGYLQAVSDPASRAPFVPKEMPYDGLKKELMGQ